MSKKIKTRSDLEQLILETISSSDMDRVRSAARKEARGEVKDLEKKLADMIKKEIKSKEAEDRMQEIVQNVILSLYKTLWLKRTFWVNQLTRNKTG